MSGPRKDAQMDVEGTGRHSLDRPCVAIGGNLRLCDLVDASIEKGTLPFFEDAALLPDRSGDLDGALRFFQHLQILLGKIGEAGLVSARWDIPLAQLGAPQFRSGLGFRKSDGIQGNFAGSRFPRARGLGGNIYPLAARDRVCACGLCLERL